MSFQVPNTPDSGLSAAPADSLDRLLAEHLAVELDSQRGKALTVFRQQMSGQVVASGNGGLDVVPIPISRGAIPRRALWYWAGVPSLIAACLALVATLQFVALQKEPVQSSNGPAVAGIAGNSASDQVAEGNGNIVFDDSPRLDQTETWRDINGDVIVLSDNTPVRPVRRQSVRQTQWVDPTDHATYSLTEPVEKVGYIQVQPY